ncbi:MAG TPA: glycosyl hydrolase, partial [Burkholderiales bacterium]|nr:glycosyl hydrolase [Burkholderiales bacterium]
MTRTLALIFLLLSGGGVGAAELGVYRWDAPGGPANVDAFELWLGKPVQLAEAFEARDIWDNIDGAAWQLGPWSQWVRAKAGRNLVLGVPMLPATSGVSLDQCAAGQYDAYWRNLANELAYYGLHWAYLRLGWEMDGNWYAWGAPQGSGREAAFAGCFRRVVTTMRATQPASQWKFVWNPTATWTDPAWLNATWPGDAYVDVVGIDLYDQSWAANTYPYPSTCDSACRLARQQTAWNGYAWYLQTMRNFAVSHGKPLAIPEWGLYTRSDGHGGGDNPYYIRKMSEFIADPGNYVQFNVYFDVTAPDGDHQISAPTAFPQSASVYQQLFGAAPAPTPTPTPTPTPAPTVDTTPPSVFLSLPSAGTTIARRSTVSVEATAADNVGVAAVEFSVNGRLACRVVASPWRCAASVGNKNE